MAAGERTRRLDSATHTRSSHRPGRVGAAISDVDRIKVSKLANTVTGILRRDSVFADFRKKILRFAI